MIENTHRRPTLIYRRVEGDPFESKEKAKGEGKSNRDNPTFKKRRNLMNPNDITFSNRDKNTPSALPHLRPRHLPTCRKSTHGPIWNAAAIRSASHRQPSSSSARRPTHFERFTPRPNSRPDAAHGSSIALVLVVEIPAETNQTLSILGRGGLVLVLLGLAVSSTRQGIASRLGRQGTLERLQRAQKWDPSNPSFPVATAELLSNSPELDPPRVVSSLETAMREGPNRALNWALLGEADELAGDDKNAATAFERGLALFPKSPKINWVYANFLVRAGNPQRALGLMRVAIAGDPALRTGAFDLAWRAGLPAGEILEAVPDDPQALSAYLDYLSRTNRLDAAKDVWLRLMAGQDAIDRDAAFRYFDALLYARQLDAMTGVWSDLVRHNAMLDVPARFPAATAGSNLVLNGGFEAPVLNGGFDWRLVPIEGAQIFVDAGVMHQGAHSLYIGFDGAHNIDFGNVVQYVLVEPDTKYRFTAYARAEKITTDSGPRFAIYDAIDTSALSVATRNMTGTFPWEGQQVEFATGPGTRLLAIQVQRPPSRKLDNEIAGNLWIDDVELIRVP
jgi:tetratricopeptide (TPR) repeat protein